MTKRQKAFVQAMFSRSSFMNATKSAEKAGYSVHTAYSIGSRLLRNVEVDIAIQNRQKELKKKFKEETIKTLAELDRIGHFDIRTLYDENGSLKNISKMTDEEAAGISSIETVRRKDGDDWGDVDKIRTKDSIRALELIGKSQGMFNDITAVIPENLGVVRLPAKVPVGAKISEEDMKTEKKEVPA